MYGEGILCRQHQPAFQPEMLHVCFPQLRFFPQDRRVARDVFLRFGSGFCRYSRIRRNAASSAVPVSSAVTGRHCAVIVIEQMREISRFHELFIFPTPFSLPLTSNFKISASVMCHHFQYSTIFFRSQQNMSYLYNIYTEYINYI